MSANPCGRCGFKHVDAGNPIQCVKEQRHEIENLKAIHEEYKKNNGQFLDVIETSHKTVAVSRSIIFPLYKMAGEGTVLQEKTGVLKKYMILALSCEKLCRNVLFNCGRIPDVQKFETDINKEWNRG